MSIELTKIGPNPTPPVASMKFAGMAAVLATDNRGRTRACWEDEAGNLFPGPVVNWAPEDVTRRAAKQTARDQITAAIEERINMLFHAEIALAHLPPRIR